MPGTELQCLSVQRQSCSDRVIALAGNPNVGKSTVFNSLTGLNQHTGNWPGKTVANVQGAYMHKGTRYIFVDIPGTYSLMSHSAEEEIARNFICFGNADGVVVVCDATCLERNLNLLLQALEITPDVTVCVNMLDEARHKHIHVDLKKLSGLLGVSVIGTSARSGKGLDRLADAVEEMCRCENCTPLAVRYTKPVEDAIAAVEPYVREHILTTVSSRWIALKLLDYDKQLVDTMSSCLGYDFRGDRQLQECLERAWDGLREQGIDGKKLRDIIVSCVVLTAEDLSNQVVDYTNADYNAADRRADRILAGKWTAFPVMVLMLALIFWITISGANYPSELLSNLFFRIEDWLAAWFGSIGAPAWVTGMLVSGVYRTLAWVVSVMLPPMAIFFPLFTLLEDLGYLPRVAFNLDKCFQCAKTCGKQALTMCMGFGCNAVGVTGCRIIDSPRERLIAILTNVFVPCNGRFPTLISIITMFFVAQSFGAFSSVVSSCILTAVILLGVGVTFAVSKLLSATVLKGAPSSFALELPPYRRPQVGAVIVRSVLDRTLFVLGRAAAVAAPAGLVIWILANVDVYGASLLSHCAAFLDPAARLLGMDGVILMAFILGFPANEIVIPLIVMSYLSTGSMVDVGDLSVLRELFVQQGWTWATAVSVLLFSLLHWPCSTTLLTIHKETKSWKWTGFAFILPTAVGVILCLLFNMAVRLFGFC